MTTASSQVKAPPKQVAAQAAQADELHKEIYGDDLTEEQTNQDIDALLSEVESPDENRTKEQAQAKPAGEEAAPKEEKSPREDWKQKYYVLKGKYDAEVPRLHDDVKDLKSKVQELSSRPEPKQPDPKEEGVAPGFKYMKEDEIEDYGPDFFDMVGRRAQEVAEQQFSPVIDGLRSEITELKTQLANTGQRVQHTETENFYAKLDRTVEDWREINSNPDFVDWLDTVIPETDGITRKQMLMKAFNAGDVSHVATFFKNWKSVSGQENAPNQTGNGAAQGTEQSTLSMQNFVSPTSGQGSPQGAPAANGQSSQKIWTQAEIAQFYRNAKDGKYRNRPDDKAKIEASIVKAVSEGRVR